MSLRKTTYVVECYIHGIRMEDKGVLSATLDIPSSRIITQYECQECAKNEIFRRINSGLFLLQEKDIADKLIEMKYNP